MDQRDLVQYAKSLYDAHGGKAEAEAAQKALNAQQDGRIDDATRWGQIRAHIRELRSPAQT